MNKNICNLKNIDPLLSICRSISDLLTELYVENFNGYGMNVIGKHKGIIKDLI